MLEAVPLPPPPEAVVVPFVPAAEAPPPPPPPYAELVVPFPPLLPCDGETLGVFPVPPVSEPAPAPAEPPPEPPFNPAGFALEPPPPPPAEVMLLNTELEPLEALLL